MKILNFFLLCLLLICCHVNRSNAQYIPLNTNYMFNLLPFNPAYAGTFQRVDVTLNVRQQWAGIEGAPATQLITFHKPIRKKKSAYGASVMNDTIGVTNEIHFSGYYSYKIAFPGRQGKKRYVSLGVSLGGSRFSTNIQKIFEKLDPKLNPAFNDPLSQENINTTWAMEGSAGVMYYTQQYFLSISSPYIFFTPFDSSVTIEQARQIFLYTGYRWAIRKNFGIRPSILIRIADASSLVPELSVLANYSDIFRGGIAYRFQQSLSIIVQLKMTERIALGYAFDYVTNGLKQNFGSHELMINYNLPLEIVRGNKFEFF